MFHKLVLFCLCWRWLTGFLNQQESKTFGAETNETQSATEGDCVTLNTDVTDIHEDDDIFWHYRHKNIAKFSRDIHISSIYDNVLDGRFRDRLKLDQTGSLTITNITTQHAGVYRLETSGVKWRLKTFSVSVYAHLPVPNITRDCSPSSSSQQNCSLLCSVVNVSHVTLSWFKGNSVLSSISVSDLSTSRSLSLEVEYQENNNYSCVLNNPIRNHTTHLDISQLCQPCSAPVSLIALISSGSLLILVAVGIFCICRKSRKTDQEVLKVDDAAVQDHDEEIIYSNPTFYKQNTQEMMATEDNHVEYASVCIRC